MSTPRLFVGLMSGTSLDCVDAVVARFDGEAAHLVFSNSTPIPEELRLRVLELAESPSTTLEEVGRVDRELGTLFARATIELLEISCLGPADISAVGSHGQTIRHRPGASADAPGFTLQIGDPNTIAELTGICTVADFRRRDVAAGGQGAPLVPAFHQSAFSKRGVERIVANIGGMANISLLPGDGRPARGFDTGPGNVLLDAWILRHLRHPFDLDGRWAETGTIDQRLLARLLDHPFLLRAPPKSTGREDFNILWLQEMLASTGREIAPQDVQATLLEFTARSLTAGVLDAMPECEEVYL